MHPLIGLLHFPTMNYFNDFDAGQVKKISSKDNKVLDLNLSDQNEVIS